MSSDEVLEMSKEIGRNEVVTGAKINREKSIGFGWVRERSVPLYICICIHIHSSTIL